MTIQDIALFKSYIESNTLREIFIRGYRKSALFSKNPASVEQFLSNVEPEDVIKKAITNFTTNSNYGYDFWQNANENWLVFLRQGRSRHSYTDYHKLIELEGMFRVLRENWDAAKAWLYEPVETALRRLGLQKVIEESVCPEDSSQEEELQCSEIQSQEDFSGIPEFDEEFEFFDLKGSRSRTNKLKKNDCSMNFRSHSYKIVLNQDITKKIRTNLYKYVRLGKTKTGDIILQLHKEESVHPVNISYNTRNGDSITACINSKELCEKLKILLNLTGDYFILHIEELSSNYDKATFKISKK